MEQKLNLFGRAKRNGGKRTTYTARFLGDGNCPSRRMEFESNDLARAVEIVSQQSYIGGVMLYEGPRYCGTLNIVRKGEYWFSSI
ncbi:hypothetical protein [Qipengyuania atrilutea]|uniref:Uncharacterized protein n=1 Tax=Qipengyuania atrilutea TaxID=2744473 RepID=A0A850HCD7_9SPHN|nr:hypothetical protein [Actirhodobacter atriluteus]NVD44769.1 hypothetical protein [Actirhodobacter atriluteus]